MNGISALTKEILESFFTLPGHVRIQREVGGLPNRGITPGLLHCRWILYRLNHQGNPQGKAGNLEHRREFSTEPNHAGTLISDFNSPGI